MIKFGLGSVGKIGFAAGMIELGIVVSPWAKRDRCGNLSVVGAPVTAQFLPFFPDLKLTWLRLNGNIAVRIKPGGSEASIHVG